jgi:excisionase family DNA binding protein
MSKYPMKIEIDDTVLINAIVEKVVERLKPLLNNSHSPKDNELMDVKGLAEYLKVKPSWVYEKVHTRQIPFRKVGKFPRFRKKHIDLWTLNPYHPDLSIYNLNHNGKGGEKT